MKRRESRGWRRRVDEAGSVEEKQRTLEGGITAFQHDIDYLELHELSPRRLLFREKLKVWLSTHINGMVGPFIISEDHRFARMLKYASIACILLESILAGWIFLMILGFTWYPGVVMAFLSALLVHGAISLVFRRVDRPKETLGRIKRYMLWPSLVLFGISFSILLLARVLTGPLAFLLAPLFTPFLWGTTLALLLMAGSFLAAAHVIDWSYKDTKEYKNINKEVSKTKILLKEFQSELEDLKNHNNVTVKREEVYSNVNVQTL